MKKIITKTQARLLDMLSKQTEGVSKLFVMKSLGIGDKSVNALTEYLAYREFITRRLSSGGNTTPSSIAITDAGLLALEYYNRPDSYVPVLVPPPTRNVLAGFHRVRPMAGAFARNDGHRLIQSRGVAC